MILFGRKVKVRIQNIMFSTLIHTVYTRVVHEFTSSLASNKSIYIYIYVIIYR